jgi:proteasome assembly chaperone (PAC2) family protein
MNDFHRVGVDETDQMMESAAGLANTFLARMANSMIANSHGDEKTADLFLHGMVNVLSPLDSIQLCTVIYELAARLAVAMIDSVGGPDKLKDAMDKGHVLGMTTNKELAFRDLPSL